MKKILMFLIAALAAFGAWAQELGDVKIGASFGVVNDGLSAEAVVAFPMNYMFEVALNGEFEEDYSNMYPSLNTNISAVFFGDHFRYFELWAVTGFGWGHDFRKGKQIDHNFHTYNIGAIGAYNPTDDWTIYVKPMVVWRDWQGNIGLKKYHPVVLVGFTKRF